jgi:PAS domain S-box-containing protein
MKNPTFSSMTSWLSGRKPASQASPRLQARILAAQETALELLASRQPLHEVLTALVRTIEEQCRGTTGSVLLLDEHDRLRHGAGPGLPDEYNNAVDGASIGPRHGTCGTAAYRRERVLVEEIATDPLWADFPDLKALAAKYDLRAAWSQPIFSADGKVLGTFAMYYKEPRRPDPADEQFIETAAQLASVAIETKRAEQALQESETRLRQVIDLVPHMIFAKDREGRFLFANRTVAEAYGTTHDELVGKRHAAIHEGQGEVDRMLADDCKVIESGQPKFIPEEEFTDSKGELRVLQTTKIPFKQPGSDELAMVGIAIDITDRRREQEKRNATERRVLRQTAVLIELAKCEQLCSSDFRIFARLATETAAHTLGVERVGVWLFNDDRTILRCVELYELSKNWHSDGLEVESATHPHYFAALERGRRVAAHDAFTHPDTSEFAEDYLKPHGITSMLDAPLRLGEELLGVVCHEHVGQQREWASDEQDFASTVADLLSLALEAGKRLRAEQAFRSAQEELLRQQWNARQQTEAELDVVKDDLVRHTRLATVGQIAASVAHELRAPLTAIRRAAECVREGMKNEPASDCINYVSAVEQESITAEAIVDNLTRLSGQREPVKKTVSLAEAVRDAMGHVSEADGMRLETSFEPETFEVDADPELLRTVLINLISNSVRATDGVGQIELEAHRDDGFDVITMRDDGPGIDPSVRDRVFEPLCTTREGAVGLGLTVCRQVVEQHGGSIELVESGDRGTAFRIRLPGQAQ